jgi:hypothetical protein
VPTNTEPARSLELEGRELGESALGPVGVVDANTEETELLYARLDTEEIIDWLSAGSLFLGNLKEPKGEGDEG